MSEEALEAHMTAGQSLRSQGRLEEAMGEFEKVLGINAQHAEARLELARMYLGRGRVEDARRAVAQACEAVLSEDLERSARAISDEIRLAEGHSEFVDRIKKSKSFCMVPWLHLTFQADGNAYPCCVFDRGSPLGSLRETSLEEIWNSRKTRELRLNMLEGKSIPQCELCDHLEAIGSPTMRQDYKQRAHPDQFAAVERTSRDGSVAVSAINRVNLAFSNICNFKCRYCSPTYSTSWYSDYEILHGPSSRPRRVLMPTEKPGDIVRQIEPLIGHLNDIWFFGGEPLMAPEHYQLLKILIENKRTDVALSYNTNFSVTALSGVDVFELWKQFPTVDVWASLDAMGARGEYIRKNQDWARVSEDRERMRRICPHVRFNILATVTVMNALHLPELHREWIEKGYLRPQDIVLNPLLTPEELCIQVFPEDFKREMADRYERHIEWLIGRCGQDAGNMVGRHFRSLVNFAMAKDETRLLDKFRGTTRALDKIRGERLEDVFPELAGLMRDGNIS